MSTQAPPPFIPLTNSEHTYDFHRPVTEEALRRFDPDLALVWNNRYQLFQVMRKRPILREYFLEGFGNLAVLDWRMIWVMDWEDGLVGSDNPDSMIAELEACDIVRHPNLMQERRQQVDENVKKAREKIHDMWVQETKENKRQLNRVYAPLRGHAYVPPPNGGRGR